MKKDIESSKKNKNVKTITYSGQKDKNNKINNDFKTVGSNSKAVETLSYKNSNDKRLR